uniref:Hemojuvelin BMP co-receptor n=1 Tax=Salvator merianae TaxID=96440 RepID=A0A8D0AYG5_SALMN
FNSLGAITEKALFRVLPPFFCFFFPHCPAVSHCKIRRCSSKYLAAMENLPEVDPNRTAAYCEALHSYSICTQKTVHICRGEIAYRSVVSFIKNQIIRNNCSEEGPVSPPQLPTLAGNHHLHVCDYEKCFACKHGAPPAYQHCAVFGDPHVWTFSDEFYTCQVEGSWPLLDNNYLYVQAASNSVAEEQSADGLSATAIDKLTIIFKNMKECVDEKNYHPEIDNLPAAFTDSSVNGGERPGGSSLTIHERVPGRHVEIRATYIGTTIAVRQAGKHLSFSIQTAEEVALNFTDEQDLQLCMGGCPPSQRISRGRHCCWNGNLTAQEAHRLCKARLPVEDAYFHACVFDVMASGDVAFALATLGALEDIRSFHPDAQRLHIYHTSGVLRLCSSFLLLSAPAVSPLGLLLFLGEY